MFLRILYKWNHGICAFFPLIPVTWLMIYLCCCIFLNAEYYSILFLSIHLLMNTRVISNLGFYKQWLTYTCLFFLNHFIEIWLIYKRLYIFNVYKLGKFGNKIYTCEIIRAINLSITYKSFHLFSYSSLCPLVYKSPLYIFFFCCLYCWYKNLLPNLKSWRYMPMFFPNNFIVLALLFWL